MNMNKPGMFQYQYLQYQYLPYKFVDNILMCTNSTFTSLSNIPNIHLYTSTLEAIYCYNSLDLTDISIIEQCPNLEIINCSWCVNIKVFPKNLSKCSKLKKIYCQYCSFSELPNSLYNCPITYLDCSMCVNLKNVPIISTLNVLLLSGCDIKDLSWINRCNNIVSIVCHKCISLTFINWSNIDKYININEIHVSDNYEKYRKELCKEITFKIYDELIRNPKLYLG